MTTFQFSGRRACKLVNLRRSTWFTPLKPRSLEHIRVPLLEAARARPRYGYRRLAVLLWNKGIRVGKNTVYKVYKQERLGLRHRKFKKRRTHLRVLPPPALQPNDRWAMDFITDETTCGRKFRVLNVIDIASRKIVGEVIDRRLPSDRVVECLERCARRSGGYPRVITCDNGPEFISIKLDEWASTRHIGLDFITPGTPTENGYIESFHARQREECLEMNSFRTLEEARAVITDWRRDYNSLRPHSSLGDKTPNQVWKELSAQVDRRGKNEVAG